MTVHQKAIESGLSLKFEALIAWLGATAVAASVLVSFAYSNFTTKNEATENKVSIEKRLDKMESKIDSILERLPKRK